MSMCGTTLLKQTNIADTEGHAAKEMKEKKLKYLR